MSSADSIPRIERILVLRTGHIGDVVLMTPALDLLQKLFPGAEISALVRAGTEAVLRNHPLIKHVYVGGEIVGQQRMLVQQKTPLWRRLQQIPRGLRRIIELRQARFDLAVDFTGGDRTALFARFSGAPVRVAYPARGSGFLGRNLLFTHLCRTPLRPEHKVLKDVELVRTVAAATGRRDMIPELVPGPSRIYCPQEDTQWAREQWTRLSGSRTRRRILVHPASRVLYKCWEPAKWAAVMKSLQAETDAVFMVTSGPEQAESKLAQAVVEAMPATSVQPHFGDLTLGRLAALIQQADLFLGVDTAPMHIAAAAGTRVVAVFGPSQDVIWGPWGNGHHVVRSPCPCLELRRRGCDEVQGMDCLKTLTPEKVIQTAMRVLHEISPLSPGTRDDATDGAHEC